MNSKQSIRVRIYEGNAGTAYIELRDHPHELVPGIVKRSVDLQRLIPDCYGPRITLDFDEHDRPIGIEIIYFAGDPL